MLAGAGPAYAAALVDRVAESEDVASLVLGSVLRTMEGCFHGPDMSADSKSLGRPTVSGGSECGRNSLRSVPARGSRRMPIRCAETGRQTSPLSTSKTTKRSSQCSSPGIIKQPVSTQGLAGPERGNPQSRLDATAFMFQAQEQVR